MTPFFVIGVSVRTSNGIGQSTKDFEKLWGIFISLGLLEKIPNKISNSVYPIYANYQPWNVESYQLALGCVVQSLESIPRGMIGFLSSDENYIRHISKEALAKGGEDLPDCSVDITSNAILLENH